MQFQKNLIEKLYECKLSLFGGNVKEKGNQVNILSYVSRTTVRPVGRKRWEKKIFALAISGEDKYGTVVSEWCLLLTWPYYITVYTETRQGTPVSASIMQIV